MEKPVANVATEEVEDMLFIVEERVKPETDLDLAVATLDPDIPRPGDWIVDSGATSHVTRNLSAFIIYGPYRPGERNIRVADN